jgi:glycosyltransferase involved in cell wall biosynthesis
MRPRIIWLCSWYPNENDPYTGDFIQRQALAASRFADIEVVHVADASEDRHTVRRVNEHLQETIYYCRPGSKLTRYRDFFRLHESFMSDYISRKGRPDLVHVHIAMRSGLIALRWKKIYGLRFAVTEHYGIYNDEVKDRLSKRNLFFRYFTRRIFRQASAFFPVSRSLGEDVCRTVSTLPFTPIPNVVDTALFRPDLHQGGDVFRFIHVSDHTPNKNVNGILKAFRLLRKKGLKAELWLLGGSSGAGEGEEGVKVFPVMSYEEVAKTVQQADAGILYSFRETQSCVVLEWLCAGLPVIASAVGGVVELIDDTNGLLTPSNQPAQLAQAMEDMIRNYARYDRMAIAAKAASVYSYEAVGEKLLKEYRALLKDQAS